MIKPLQERFEEKITPEPMSGCWLWNASINIHGYGKFGIAGRAEAAHRVAWALYIGPIPYGLWVLHKCDNTFCVNPKHLFLGTCQENLFDMRQKNRGYIPPPSIGENHNKAKLTNEQVIAIRGDKRTQKTIAHDYGITWFTVSEIQRRKTWKHI